MQGFKTIKKGRTGKTKTYYNDQKLTLKKKKYQPPEDYAKSLLNPWLELNAKIPDLSSFPTSTFRAETNYVWNVTPSAATTDDNTILIVDLAETLGFFHCQGVSQTTAANRGDYTTGSLVSSNITLGAVLLANYYDQFRVVSAGMKIKFADNDDNTKGIIWGTTFGTCAETLQNATNYSASPWTRVKQGSAVDLSSATNWNAARNMYSGPIVDGLTLRYQPASGTSFLMIKPEITNSTDQKFNFGRFAVMVNGLTDGTPVTLHCSMVVNIEAIPLSGQIPNNAIYNSPANSAALEAGLNAISNAENAFSGSDMDVERHINTPVRYINRCVGV
nr:MAG: putative capsid protein [Arizlama virus]